MLEALFDRAPDRLLRSLPGRQTFLAQAPQAEDGEPCWVVKRFDTRRMRRGLAERLSPRRPSPARREAEAARALATLGLDVPRPLGVLERGARSLLVLERVPYVETLEQRAARAPRPERRRLAARLARCVARLHGAGWYHRDLYLCHWLVALPDRLVLIDLGRARRADRPRSRWFVKDLAALDASAPGAVGERERLAFLLRYLRERGLPAGVRARRLAARVRRKAIRLVAHRPRFGEAPRPGEVQR